MKITCEHIWCKFWKNYTCLRDGITINYKKECGECDNSHQHEPWFQEEIAKRLNEALKLKREQDRIPPNCLEKTEIEIENEQ